MNFINNPYDKLPESISKLKSFNNSKCNLENILESHLKLSEIEKKENDTIKFDSISSIKNFDFIKNNNQIDNKKINLKRNIKKLTIEDLNNIPLPIFSCIYCSNEKIAFNHLINSNLSNKYFLQTSIYDMKILDKIIKINPIVDQWNKNSPLLDVIIKNSEFIRRYYNKSELIGIYKTQIMTKIYKPYIKKNKKSIMKKLKVKSIKKRNREFNIFKSNSNKIFFSNDYKPSFQKINNNNSTFLNDNLITNKNSLTNTNCVSSSPNRGLSFSSNNNINDNINMNNNNINIGLNQNNIMQSIMEKKEVNEESECETEEKFLDILDNQINLKRKINKNNIRFEDNYYDIWNPRITTINEEENDEQNFKNHNRLREKNNKEIKKLLNLIHEMNRLSKININKNKDFFQNKKNKNGYYKINNNENEIHKKIKKYNNNIVIPSISNIINKRNIKNFNNNNEKRKSIIESPSIDNYFSNINLNLKNLKNKDYLYLLNSIKYSQNKEKYNNLFWIQKQNGYKKIFNILKPRKDNYKHIIINKRRQNKLVLQSTLSLNKYSSNRSKSNLTSINFHESERNSIKNKSIAIQKDLTLRNNNELNLQTGFNYKEINKLSSYIKIPYNSRLNSSKGIPLKGLKSLVDRDKDEFVSLPNLNLKISPINKLNKNNRIIKSYQNKKILFENNLRKINSYKIFKRKYI